MASCSVAPPCHIFLAAILAGQATVDRDRLPAIDRMALVNGGYCRHCIDTLRASSHQGPDYLWCTDAPRAPVGRCTDATRSIIVRSGFIAALGGDPPWLYATAFAAIASVTEPLGASIPSVTGVVQTATRVIHDRLTGHCPSFTVARRGGNQASANSRRCLRRFSAIHRPPFRSAQAQT